MTGHHAVLRLTPAVAFRVVDLPFRELERGLHVARLAVQNIQLAEHGVVNDVARLAPCLNQVERVPLGLDGQRDLTLCGHHEGVGCHTTRPVDHEWMRYPQQGLFALGKPAHRLVEVATIDLGLDGLTFDLGEPAGILELLGDRFGLDERLITLRLVADLEKARRQADQQIHAEFRILAVLALEHGESLVENLLRGDRAAVGADGRHDLGQKLIFGVATSFMKTRLVPLALRFAHLDQGKRRCNEQCHDRNGRTQHGAAIAADKLRSAVGEGAGARSDRLMIQVVPEIEGEGRRGRIALSRFLAQCLADDSVEVTA